MSAPEFTREQLITWLRSESELCREMPFPESAGYAEKYEAIAALLTAEGWQYIDESTPKDSVLVCEGEAVGEARLTNDGWYWANTDSSDFHACPIYPTKWMPLPSPPGQPTAAPAPTGCVWTQDDDGIYHTACNHAWVYEDSGTPADHGQKFCGYCGQPIQIWP